MDNQNSSSPVKDKTLTNVDQRLAEALRVARRIGAGEGTVRSVAAIGGDAEPHRDWHVYRLGADLYHSGLFGKDAFPLMGWRSLPLDEAVAMLLDANSIEPGAYIGRLLAIVVDRNREELDARGRLVSWTRRYETYLADRARWEAQPEDVRNGSWRARQMTVEQRALVLETAILLDLLIPDPLTRGEAADWLEAHGANLSYRSVL